MSDPLGGGWRWAFVWGSCSGLGDRAAGVCRLGRPDGYGTVPGVPDPAPGQYLWRSRPWSAQGPPLWTLISFPVHQHPPSVRADDPGAGPVAVARFRNGRAANLSTRAHHRQDSTLLLCPALLFDPSAGGGRKLVALWSGGRDVPLARSGAFSLQPAAGWARCCPGSMPSGLWSPPDPVSAVPPPVRS